MTIDAAARDAAKQQRREAACVAACTGLPTESLERVAALAPADRPAALAKLAARKAAA